MATQERKAVAEGLRLTSRIEAHDEEASQADITNARDIIASVTASVNPHVFKTSKTMPEATSAEVYFLVEEGQISADAAMRHTKPHIRLGLKFLAVNDDDRATSLAGDLRVINPQSLSESQR